MAIFYGDFGEMAHSYRSPTDSELYTSEHPVHPEQSSECLLREFAISIGGEIERVREQKIAMKMNEIQYLFISPVSRLLEEGLKRNNAEYFM